MAASILVAQYLRASTDEQVESIPAQKMLLERYAKEHGLTTVAIYTDRGKSGDSFHVRAGLQQLLADAPTGKFQVVLVRNLSRLTRRNSLKTAAQIVGPLLDVGVGVWTATQGDLKIDTATGRIVLTVLSEMENQENVSRAFNTVNGLLKIAEDGYWVTVPVPWGYRAVGPNRKRELQLGDIEAIRKVRRIFKLYQQGHTLRGIAQQLNAEGVTSPDGAQWCGQTVKQRLTNPVYVGDHRYNLRARGKYYRIKGQMPVARSGHWRGDGESTVTEYNEQADWVYIPDRWPAAVDRQTWDQVQALLQANRKETSPSRDYLFSCLLRCQCGHRGHMRGYQQRTSQRRYLCEHCGATVSEQQVLAEVTKAIQHQHTPEHLDKLRGMLRSRLEQLQPKDTTSKRLRSKLERYEKRLLEVSADMLPTVEREVRALRQQLQDVEQRHRTAQFSAQDAQKRIDQAMAGFFALPKLLKRKQPAEVRRCLRQVLDHVVVETEARQFHDRRRFQLTGLDIQGVVKHDLSQLPASPCPA